MKTWQKFRLSTITFTIMKFAVGFAVKARLAVTTVLFLQEGILSWIISIPGNAHSKSVPAAP